MANIYINALNSPIHLIRKVKLSILLIFIALNVQYITAVKQTGEHRSLVTIVKQGNGESCHSFLCLFRDTNSQCSNIVLFSDRYVSLTCVRGCSQSMSVKNGGGADTPPSLAIQAKEYFWPYIPPLVLKRIQYSTVQSGYCCAVHLSAFKYSVI